MDQPIDIVVVWILAKEDTLPLAQTRLLEQVDALRSVTRVHCVTDEGLLVDNPDAKEIMMLEVRRGYAWAEDPAFNEDDWKTWMYLVVCDAVAERCDPDSYSTRLLFDLELDVTKYPPEFWSEVDVVSASADGRRFPLGEEALHAMGSLRPPGWDDADDDEEPGSDEEAL